MTEWINFDALWKIVVIGIVAGAGLPAVFAVGLKALVVGERESGGGAAVTRNPAALAAAVVCFAVVLAAVGWGIYLIVDK